MTQVILNQGDLQAIFAPLGGMNLLSFKQGDLEVIDQSTISLYKERFAGLGAMIGPHFHRQKPELIARNFDESLFPHIARVKAAGTLDPFSHGIGRYAPWQFEQKPNRISATLSSSMRWNDVKLALLEGCKFEMSYDAELQDDGLHISLTSKSERPTIIGLHTYYRIDQESSLTCTLSDVYNDMGEFKPLPSNWTSAPFDLSNEYDLGFPPPKKQGLAKLDTSTHTIKIDYASEIESSLQLWHPKDGSFACVEPLGARNPRNLTSTESKVDIVIRIARK